MFNKIGFEKLLEITAKDLSVIREDLKVLYTSTILTDEEKAVFIADAFINIDHWSDYYNRFKEILDSKIVELVNRNTELVSENNRLRKLTDEQSKEIEDKNIEIGTLQGRLETAEEIISVKDKALSTIAETLENKLFEVSNLIEENAKALVLSKKLKTDPKVNTKGEGHPRYKEDIDNDKLIKEYNELLEFNSKQTDKKYKKAILKELSDKYKLSIPGIRNRLIDLGVYQSQYETNK